MNSSSMERNHEQTNQPGFPLYGFRYPSFVNFNEYTDFETSYKTTTAKRESRWTQKFPNPMRLKRSRALKRFCRKGLPPEYRPEVWLTVSGARERLLSNPGVYAAATSKNPEAKVLNVILADVPRTFPENLYFRNPDAHDNLLESLTRVLKAFAVQFPNIGYCQGFNYITAIILLVLREQPKAMEERAFWLLETLVNQILPNYYADDMVSLRRDCKVLGELLRSIDPALHDVILKCGINYTALCAKWFICLYADVLPIETTLRIFDCLFYEGDKILFRAGLTLIDIHRTHLLECQEFPDLLTTFRNMCRDKQTLWCNQFLRAMFKIPKKLSRSKIAKLRDKCEIEVRNET